MTLSLFRINTCISADSKGLRRDAALRTITLLPSGEKPQGSADSALRYRCCLSKRKCGNLVAARRGFTWICPNVIIAKFGLHSKEKHFGERQRRDAECAEIRREERVGDGVHAVKAAARPPHCMKGRQPEMAVPHVITELQSIWTERPGGVPG